MPSPRLKMVFWKATSKKHQNLFCGFQVGVMSSPLRVSECIINVRVWKKHLVSHKEEKNIPAKRCEWWKWSCSGSLWSGNASLKVKSVNLLAIIVQLQLRICTFWFCYKLSRVLEANLPQLPLAVPNMLGDLPVLSSMTDYFSGVVKCWSDVDQFETTYIP